MSIVKRFLGAILRITVCSLGSRRPEAARLAVVLLSGIAIASAGVEVPGRAQTSRAADPTGDVRNVHDPSIVKAGDTYYVFSTRAGISVRCSKDLVNWRLCGDVFAHLPQWAVKDVPGLRGLWAPDVSYFNGRYHLYYSCSTFGSNRSSIGLVTNATLDPASDAFKWEDQGKVLGSETTDDWNAIDPNIVLDEKGQPWLSFGSFWSGIKLRKIDPTTGKLDAKDPTLYSLAGRPRSSTLPGAVEAPFIVRKHEYYYLFVSFDFCCRGKDSTYNVRVGRSRDVKGPYVDKDGKDLREGGGSLVVAGEGRWRGPGHCSVLSERDGDRIVYHAYDADARGASTLRINPIVWDSQGWPTIR
jgi:arabinan endo-1,5-alpha-L-arabinosidase